MPHSSRGWIDYVVCMVYLSSHSYRVALDKNRNIHSYRIVPSQLESQGRKRSSGSRSEPRYNLRHCGRGSWPYEPWFPSTWSRFNRLAGRETSLVLILLLVYLKNNNSTPLIFTTPSPHTKLTITKFLTIILNNRYWI